MASRTVSWGRIMRRHGKTMPHVQATKPRKQRRCLSIKAIDGRKPDAGWKLSDRDYPEGEVILGMEIRTHSAKAALVDTANAEFHRPGVTTYLDDLSVQSVQEAMKKITKHYHWNGPVGVSVTRAVTRVLGNQAAGKQLEAMMPDSKGKVATMIHTEAAAYAEMYFGPGRECEGVVLVVTVGTGMGTVTYNLGQKVRNSDLKHLTWTYERELAKMKEKWGWNGVAPELPEDCNDDGCDIIQQIIKSPPSKYSKDGSVGLMDCPEYEKIEGMKPVIAWAYLVDRYLQKVAEAVKPDKLILLTTGAAAKLPEELLVPLFTPAITGAGLKPDVLVLGDFPERALVKGAALGAHIELGRRAAGEVFRAALTQTITGSPHPREIYKQDLLWAFKRLDRDKDGVIGRNDLLEGAHFIGTTLSDAEATGLLRDFTGGMMESATPDQFLAWYDRILEVAMARVVEVHNVDEFEHYVEEALEKPASSGLIQDEGALVVLECGYTHCRPCMKFEKTYEIVAKKYVDTVFLRVLGDESPGAAHLCRDVLDVQGTPEFRFFRGKKLVHVMRGADKGKLEKSLQSLLVEGEVGFALQTV